MSAKSVPAVLLVLVVAGAGAWWWMGREEAPSPRARVVPDVKIAAPRPMKAPGAGLRPPLGPPPRSADDGPAPAPSSEVAAAALQALLAVPAAAGDPGADYARVIRFVADADHEGVAPSVLGRSCQPPPCVLSLAWNASGEGFEQFHQDLMAELFAAGEGIGQPSVFTAQPEEGLTRAWVFWSADAMDPAQGEALAQSALARIRADGGPVD